MNQRVNIFARKSAGIEGLVAVESWIGKSFNPKLLATACSSSTPGASPASTPTGNAPRSPGPNPLPGSPTPMRQTPSTKRHGTSSPRTSWSRSRSAWP